MNSWPLKIFETKNKPPKLISVLCFSSFNNKNSRWPSYTTKKPFKEYIRAEQIPVGHLIILLVTFHVMLQSRIRKKSPTYLRNKTFNLIMGCVSSELAFAWSLSSSSTKVVSLFSRKLVLPASSTSSPKRPAAVFASCSLDPSFWRYFSVALRSCFTRSDFASWCSNENVIQCKNANLWSTDFNAYLVSTNRDRCT